MKHLFWQGIVLFLFHYTEHVDKQYVYNIYNDAYSHVKSIFFPLLEVSTHFFITVPVRFHTVTEDSAVVSSTFCFLLSSSLTTFSLEALRFSEFTWKSFKLG